MRATTAALGLLAALSSPTAAHTVFTTLFIDDVNQGDGTCVRMPHDGSTSTDPIRPITSTDMACGRDGLSAVAFTCPAAAGAKLTFEFREWADASGPGSIDASHRGPCAVYLKQVGGAAADDDNTTTAAADGDGWFKIWDSGYDEATGRFCTDQLIADGGLLSVALPPALPTGYFLARAELLALQQADKGDPQFYVGCAQLFVRGTVATLDVPADRKVAIPGHVRADDRGLTFNIYDEKLALPYPVPGPEVYFPVLPSGAPAAAAAQKQAQVQTQGAIPADCLIKNANWCGLEVAAYADEAGCWAASEACYAQAQACYDQAPASGSANCHVWEDAKCKAIQDACAAGSFVGPPDKGARLVAVEAAVPGPIPPPAERGAADATTTVEVGGDGGQEGGAATTVAVGDGGAPTSSAMAAAATTAAVVGQDGAAASPTTATAAEQETPTPTSTPTGGSGGSGSTQGSCHAEIVSKNGLCGGVSGQTCSGSSFGACCSRFGRCGSSRLHCGLGCQGVFGQCN